MAALARRADRGVERWRDGGAGARSCSGGCGARARRGSSARARHDPSRRSLRCFLRHAAGVLRIRRALRRAADTRRKPPRRAAHTPRSPHAAPCAASSRSSHTRACSSSYACACRSSGRSPRHRTLDRPRHDQNDSATPTCARRAQTTLAEIDRLHACRPRVVRYAFCDYLLRADAADAAAIFDHFGTVCAAP